jgi:hypothetical protein
VYWRQETVRAETQGAFQPTEWRARQRAWSYHRVCEALHQAQFHRIVADFEDDWNGLHRCFEMEKRSRRRRTSDPVTQAATQGLSRNKIRCARKPRSRALAVDENQASQSVILVTVYSGRTWHVRTVGSDWRSNKQRIEAMTKSINEKLAQDISEDRLDQVSGGSALNLSIHRQDVAQLQVRNDLMGRIRSVMICSSCHGCGGGAVALPSLGER